jgi:hypothetical protein
VEKKVQVLGYGGFKDLYTCVQRLVLSYTILSNYYFIFHILSINYFILMLVFKIRLV